MKEEFKLGPTALVAVMKVLQDALLEGKDASQGLRDLRFETAGSVHAPDDFKPVVVLEAKK